MIKGKLVNLFSSSAWHILWLVVAVKCVFSSESITYVFDLSWIAALQVKGTCSYFDELF